MKRFKDLEKGDTIYEYFRGMISKVKVKRLVRLSESGMLYLEDNTGGIYMETLDCSLFNDHIYDRTLFLDLNFKYFFRLKPWRRRIL